MVASAYQLGFMDMDNEKLIVVARGFVKPDRRDELMDLFRKLRDMDEEREPGTIVQSFQFERDNPNVFLEYMVFENEEARAIHHQHLGEIGHLEKVKDIFATWPYVVKYRPLCAKGIDFTTPTS
jgi:quinol monooxygenase YgiN